MKQIPKEGGAFQAMDATWRSIMQAVHDNPLMLTVADMEGLLQKLRVRGDVANCGAGVLLYGAMSILFLLVCCRLLNSCTSCVWWRRMS